MNERKMLADNEDMFIPVLEQLKTAVKVKDTDNVKKKRNTRIDVNESQMRRKVSSHLCSLVKKYVALDSMKYDEAWSPVNLFLGWAMDDGHSIS